MNCKKAFGDLNIVAIFNMRLVSFCFVGSTNAELGGRNAQLDGG